MGKCIMCGKETRKVLYSKAIVKIYICSEECLKKYYKPLKGYKPKIQKKLTEGDGWLDRMHACISNRKKGKCGRYLH